MPNLRAYIAKIAIIILSLTYFLSYIEILGQESNALSSSYRRCWELEINKTTLQGFVSDNKFNIYLSLLDGKIESINLKTGKKNWESELGGKFILPPLSDDKNIYVVSRIETKILLRSLTKDLGITNWQANFDFSKEFFLIKDKEKLILISKDGKFSRVDKDSGALIWSKDLKLELSSAPILFENQIVFGTKSKKIFFYSIENGNILYEFYVLSSPNIISVIKDKYLFWGDYKGNAHLAYLSDLITKKVIWKIRSGAEISNIYTTRQGLLILSLDNFIYLVSTEKGKFIWKKRFDGRLLLNTIILNKYIVVATFASQFADIIDIESGRLVDQFVIGDSDYFLDKPLVLNNLFIFPTIKGFVVFTNSKVECAFN